MHLTIRLETLLVETFSVVLGILLALAANAWHDQRAHDAAAREALRNIRSEMSANREALAAKITYHGEMHDSIDSVVAHSRGGIVPGGLRAIHGWNGIAPTRLVDNAWTTASATGAMQYIQYGDVLQLSKCYALQERIAEVQRAFFSVVYTPTFASGGVYAMASMSSFLRDLSATERQLMTQYDSELSTLNQRLGQS